MSRRLREAINNSTLPDYNPTPSRLASRLEEIKTIDAAVVNNPAKASRAAESDKLAKGFGYDTKHFDNFVNTASTGGKKSRRQRQQQKQQRRNTQRQRKNRKQSKKNYKK